MAQARVAHAGAYGLPPVLPRDARILVLGSFPGVASLTAGRYYAHPRNHFWPVMGAILGEPLPAMSYDDRLARLAARGIALWDTIVACDRKGSSDQAIRHALHAEVSRVQRASPDIVAVAFNGKTAARAAPRWREAGYATVALPSTSPAYTRPLAEKIEAWRALEAWL
jgi:hypoxanthine-DNA glycosylase